MAEASRVRAAVFAKDLNRGEDMKIMDFAKAFGVVIATLVITVAASFPMVAFYAYFIEPGHPQEFYNEAALWIAPWSSYVLGPVCFLAFNFWLARRSPERNAMVFAAATIGLYVLFEIAMMPMLSQPVSSLFTLSFGLSLLAKAVGAFLGAHLGSRNGSAGDTVAGAA